MNFLKKIKKNKLFFFIFIFFLFVIIRNLNIRENYTSYKTDPEEIVDEQINQFDNHKNKIINHVNKIHDNVINKHKKEERRLNKKFYEFAEENEDTIEKIDEIIAKILSNIVDKRKYFKKSRNELLKLLEDP